VLWEKITVFPWLFVWLILNVWMEWQVALLRKNHPKCPGCIVGKKDARVWALAFPDDSSV